MSITINVVHNAHSSAPCLILSAEDQKCRSK